MTFYIALFTIINLSLWIMLFVRLKNEFAPTRVLQEIRLEVEKLIIEINKEVDQDISLIEARRAGLKELLEKIDQRIYTIDKKIGLIDQENALFKEEQKILERLSPQNAYIKNKKKTLKQEPSLFSEELQETSKGRSLVEDSFISPPKMQQKTNEQEGLNDEPIHISFSKNPINQVQATKDFVLNLSRQGKSAKEIAETLKMPVREVGFILDLHNS